MKNIITTLTTLILTNLVTAAEAVENVDDKINNGVYFLFSIIFVAVSIFVIYKIVKWVMQDDNKTK